MKLVLTEQDLIILDKALQQMPYGAVAGLINKINSQLIEQANPESNEPDEPGNS